MSAHLCFICTKSVRINLNSVFCKACCSYYLKKCLKLESFDTLCEPWYCQICLNSVFPFNHYTSDDEFIGEMYSFCNLTAGSATIDRLKNLSYNPFSYDRKRPIINNCDFDPGVNYFNTQVTDNKCMYFLPGELKECNCTPHQGVFSLLHINAQSLQYKYDMIDD